MTHIIIDETSNISFYFRLNIDISQPDNPIQKIDQAGIDYKSPKEVTNPQFEIEKPEPNDCESEEDDSTCSAATQILNTKIGEDHEKTLIDNKSLNSEDELRRNFEDPG